MQHEAAIRHAYENVLTAGARLAAFATCQPIQSPEHLISGRQKILAVDDLVIFAINARRLMDSSGTLKKFSRLMFPTTEFSTEQNQINTVALAITKIINTFVHHRFLEIMRFEHEFVVSDPNGGRDAIYLYEKYLEIGNASFPPMVAVKSDQGGLIVIKLAEMLEFFENEVLLPIIEICAENHLELNPFL
jgi:hypothetical protein